METGRKILNLRKDRGVPQKTLAEQTAVTASALSRIEAGIHQPRGPVALRIARQLGVTADYLLDDTAPYPPPGREVLSNLGPAADESPSERIEVTPRERRVIEALRGLDDERRQLLDATLDAPREKVRYAAFLLGSAEDLPGADSEEVSRYRELGGR